MHDIVGLTKAGHLSAYQIMRQHQHPLVLSLTRLNCFFTLISLPRPDLDTFQPSTSNKPQPPRTMKDSKGWDGKLRVGKQASTPDADADPDTMDDSSHSDTDRPAEGGEVEEVAQSSPLASDEGMSDSFHVAVARVGD